MLLFGRPAYTHTNYEEILDEDVPTFMHENMVGMIDKRFEQFRSYDYYVGLTGK